MTNNQLESDDIRVDYEMDVDCDIGQEITCYIEIWFDVDSKFHINTDDDDIWLNMYAKYNPFEDTLRVECEIDNGTDSQHFECVPTRAEAQLLKDKITEKIAEVYEMAPQELCDQFAEDSSLTIGGIE